MAGNDDDDFVANLIAANEGLGEAQTAIGMALGLDPPRTGATWGAPEILARIAELGAQAETLRGRLRELTAMESRAQWIRDDRSNDDADRLIAREILGEAS